jgi:hypothetical protein
MGRNSHGTERGRIAPDLVKEQGVSFFHEKTDRSGAIHCLTATVGLTHSEETGGTDAGFPSPCGLPFDCQ